MRIINKFKSKLRAYPKKENYDLNLNRKYEKIALDVKNNIISPYNPNLKYYDAIKDSEMFDSKFYISNYKLRLHEKYALFHFLNEGFDLGFNPNDEFICKEYIRNNEDVKEAKLNPFAHYVIYGQKEGRNFPYSEHIQLKNELISLEKEVQINRIIQNVSLLRNKALNGHKINVVFILPAMMFAYKKLYDLFDNDENFNVKIVLVPHRIGNSKEITDVAKNKYYQIFSLLKERNFEVIAGFNFETGFGIDLETQCSPDIIFYVLPYMRVYPENMRVENLSPNILYVYIPYGEFIGDLDDNNFNFGWNEKIWKIFANESYTKSASSKSLVGSSNVLPIGSPRMDSLISYEESEFDYKWIYPKEENKKRIIWAPHHTLSRPNLDNEFIFSTFDKNYEFFYEYAKNNPNIEWVIRPHPLLKEVLTEVNTYMKMEGIANKDFADDYFFKWDSLPNARVHEEIDYFDLFANADAMITDCVSFKGEYLFANKPGLILTTDNFESNNEESVYDAWYKANGSDFDEITKFIENVVVDEDDYLKNKREEIFTKYLDLNTGCASEVVYNYIKRELFE